MVEAKVSGLAYDTLSKSYVVFLKEIDGEKVLPIWIGPNEAFAIAMGLQQEKAERPLTHDLIKIMIKGLNASITKIVVSDIRDSTYYARIYLKGENSITEVDARPSDSIAIAVRSSAPIYITEQVLEKGGTFKVKEKDNLKAHFQELKLEDFGKFKL